MRASALAVRFVLELAMLAAFAYWGFNSSDTTMLNIVLGIAAPLAAAIVWGTFLAPRRKTDLPIPARVVIEFIVFGLAAVALWAADQPTWAIVVAVVAVAQRAVLSALGEHSQRLRQ